MPLRDNLGFLHSQLVSTGCVTLPHGNPDGILHTRPPEQVIERDLAVTATMLPKLKPATRYMLGITYLEWCNGLTNIAESRQRTPTIIDDAFGHIWLNPVRTQHVIQLSGKTIIQYPVNTGLT